MFNGITTLYSCDGGKRVARSALELIFNDSYNPLFSPVNWLFQWHSKIICIKKFNLFVFRNHLLSHHSQILVISPCWKLIMTNCERCFMRILIQNPFIFISKECQSIVKFLFCSIAQSKFSHMVLELFHQYKWLLFSHAVKKAQVGPKLAKVSKIHIIYFLFFYNNLIKLAVFNYNFIIKSN